MRSNHRPETAVNDRAVNRWRALPELIFADLHTNGWSDRHALKSKVVERPKSYRSVLSKLKFNKQNGLGEFFKFKLRKCLIQIISRRLSRDAPVWPVIECLIYRRNKKYFSRLICRDDNH